MRSAVAAWIVSSMTIFRTSAFEGREMSARNRELIRRWRTRMITLLRCCLYCRANRTGGPDIYVGRTSVMIVEMNRVWSAGDTAAVRTSGAKAPNPTMFVSARLKLCPDTNQAAGAVIPGRRAPFDSRDSPRGRLIRPALRHIRAQRDLARNKCPSHSETKSRAGAPAPHEQTGGVGQECPTHTTSSLFPNDCINCLTCHIQFGKRY